MVSVPISHDEIGGSSQGRGALATQRRNVYVKETWKHTGKKLLVNKRLTREAAKKIVKDWQNWKSLAINSLVCLEH